MALRVVTAEEMKLIDRRATSEFGIPSIVLMENAARSICEVLSEYYGSDTIPKGQRILIVCGKGNNGGDGMALARLLHNQGVTVRVILLGDRTDLQGDARINRDILDNCGIACCSVKTRRQLQSRMDEFGPADVTVDAIFGTGFRGRPEGLYAQAIAEINRRPGLVVAVDIASGVQADDGKVLGVAVKADVTVTMGLLKRGLVFHPGREFSGDVWIGDIGIPRTKLEAEGDTFLLEASDVRCWLPARPARSHKGSFGRVLTIAGSPGYTGAACLASMAALKIGCGLSTLAVPQSSLPVVESQVLEVVKKGLPETDEGRLNLAALEPVRTLLKSADVIALGPGIGTGTETSAFELRLLREVDKPIVIDADGINNLTGQTGLLRRVKSRVVLTPHPGELARLTGLSPDEIDTNRLELARKYAREFGVILVLKGAPTVVAEPDGRSWVNPTGNSGLASGGSGDVLTGMIAGLIAQGVPPEYAACAGVYLHGLAADKALDRETEYTLVAGDILGYLSRAIRSLADPICDSPRSVRIVLRYNRRRALNTRHSD